MDPARQPAGMRARRPRAARACELCRSKKNKCDELLPCTYCKNRNVECIYQNGDKTRRMGYSTEYVRQLERQIRELSGQLSSPNKIALPDPSVPLDDVRPGHAIDSHNQNVHQSSAIVLGDADSQFQDDLKAKEVTGVNRHTMNVEFYGSSSSMALLSRVRKNEHITTTPQDTDEEEGSLVSQLYNPGLLSSPSETKDPLEALLNDPRLYYQQCRAFLHAFFGSIHYIHPILDKATFLARCEEILAGNSSSQSRSFMALYYSLLSLGALVGPRDEDIADSTGNLDWSRRFFEKARVLCGELSMTTDLEMVQCYFFMAKICQNELNPHFSYMYTGFAVRTALAIGINREPSSDSRKSFALRKAESRTWWGLYSLETEMSFAMGRPDTLGLDIYHNRQFPQIQDELSSPSNIPEMIEPRECAIIKSMVEFSRITRAVCLGIYLSPSPPQHNSNVASQIEQDLESWLDNLPPSIRPSRSFKTSRSLKSIKDPQYAKKQRLVLSIRYHNVRMLLFASFLTSSASVELSLAGIFKENVAKCLDSAKQTVDIIYETYRHHDFFRTWYYNTTYTLFAVSILLVYIVQGASESEKPSLYEYVEMSIEILETMDDCVVAKKAAKMIQRALSRAKGDSLVVDRDEAQAIPQDTAIYDVPKTFNHYWGPLHLMDGDFDINFPFELGDLDEEQPLYNDFIT